MKHGAKCVSAYVSHAIFPKGSYQKFLHQEIDKTVTMTSSTASSSAPSSDLNKKQVRFQNFWITNTLPTAQSLNGKAPFKLLSVAKLCSNLCLD